MKIKTILVLIETEEGKVHQVLAPREQKDLAVDLLRSPEGVLRLSTEVEPITLEEVQ